MSKKKVRPLPETLGFACVGVDSHAHLDGVADLAEVISAARASGVRAIGNVFLGPDAYEVSRARFDAFEDVFFLLGIHPHDAAKMHDGDVSRMARAFGDDPRLLALGEIGLDHYYDFSPRSVQERCFRQQLALALELDLRVVIHCRDAEEACVAVLDDMGFSGRPLLWHCFGLGPEWVGPFVDRGWHLSIPGTLTYAKNAALRDAVREIPADRLLLETDAPYLAPEPYRGKPNEPAFLVFTAASLAALRGEEPAALWQRCGDNARRFFGFAQD